MSESLSVLLVAGDGDFVAATKRRLGEAGADFTVEHVRDAPAAREYLETATVDCVVSAQDLPDGDGLGLLERLGAEGSDLPFILYADEGSPELAERALDAGATDYVTDSPGAARYRLLETRIRNAVRAKASDGADRSGEADFDRTDLLLENIPDPVIITDIEENILAVHGFDGWSGYSREELLEMKSEELVVDEYHETVRQAAWDLWEDPDREKVTVEMELEMKDGRRVPVENHLRFIPSDDGEEPHVMSVIRDISDRKVRERQLNALNETMQGLVTAESDEEMAEHVVETSRDVLGFDLAAVALQQADAGLEMVAASPGGAALLDVGDGEDDDTLSRAAFDSGEVRRAGELDATTDDETPVRELLVCPLGEYGVLCLGATTEEGIEDQLVPLAEILAGNVEAALDRVFYREEMELLAKRERELDLYEQAVEATGDGIAIMNEDIEFLMVNSWFAESVGSTKEELEGQGVDAEESDVIIEVPDDLEERWINTAEEARGTGRSSFLYESVIDLPAGIRTIENRVTAVREDDGEVVYVIVTRDISARKEREEQIEELHAATRRLMAADSEEAVAGEVVAAVESVLGFPANVVRLVDDAGEHLETVAVAEEAHDLLGDSYWSPIPIEGNAVGDAFQDGEAIILDDVRDHTDIYDDTSVRSVLTMPMGEYGQLGIFDEEIGAYDESDRRIAEILTSNAEAAFNRVEKEAALRERERALSRQIDRLDQFASIVSHDLRNPLNVAKGRLTFVKEQVDEMEHVEAVDGALDRMQAIIDDVLTLAREGEEATDVAPVSLKETVDSCWNTVDTRDATLEIDTDRAIVADSSRLQQLLENLLRNAIDHVGDDVTIRVGDLPDGFYLEDDGHGIPPEDQDKVFEAGYSTGDGGTGFGLNIVRTIAEAHGWSVGVTRGSDGGARFEVTGVESVGVNAAGSGSPAST